MVLQLASSTRTLRRRRASFPAAFTFASPDEAVEIIENYWQALTRDVPFANYNSDPFIQSVANDLNKPARIWYQSFVDPQEQRPYMLRLQECLRAYAAPHVTFDFWGQFDAAQELEELRMYRPGIYKALPAAPPEV